MDAQFSEHAVAFTCQGETLIGVVASPAAPVCKLGVLVVVGGPQYRAGSHRQFVLLSRHLAAYGIPCMRFDYRGMGDSSGDLRNFEMVHEDIRAALDRFFAEIPELAEVALWGLCDAASASIFYACRDPRVRGLVLLNPWVRTQSGEAKAYLKHYYLRRAVDPEFWKKAVSGRLRLKASLGNLAANVRRAASGGQAAPSASKGPGTSLEGDTLPERMASGLERFTGRVLLILSGNDMTAREFLDACGSSDRWRSLMSERRVQRIDFKDANHTFSSRAWRDEVAEHTRTWLLGA